MQGNSTLFWYKRYYVAPDNKTPDKTYLLLVSILKNTDKVAIGKVVLREKEQLVASSSISKRYYHASLALS